MTLLLHPIHHRLWHRRQQVLPSRQWTRPLPVLIPSHHHLQRG
jgi:hypothetical protein